MVACHINLLLLKTVYARFWFILIADAFLFFHAELRREICKSRKIWFDFAWLRLQTFRKPSLLTLAFFHLVFGDIQLALIVGQDQGIRNQRLLQLIFSDFLVCWGFWLNNSLRNSLFGKLFDDWLRIHNILLLGGLQCLLHELADLPDLLALQGAFISELRCEIGLAGLVQRFPLCDHNIQNLFVSEGRILLLDFSFMLLHVKVQPNPVKQVVLGGLRQTLSFLLTYIFDLLDGLSKASTDIPEDLVVSLGGSGWVGGHAMAEGTLILVIWGLSRIEFIGDIIFSTQ